MSRTPNIEAKEGMWYWYHNVSECYYHIQITYSTSVTVVMFVEYIF